MTEQKKPGRPRKEAAENTTPNTATSTAIITDDHVRLVELATGRLSNAWGMIEPKALIEAIVRVMR